MSGLIPEAIAEHTERGGELWRKLVGATTRDWEYELTLGRETYSFERGTEGVLTSLLTSEEAEELHDELETVVPVATEVYDSIYPSSERQSIARSVRVVEGVYGLCWVATIFNSPIVYTMSV